MKVGENCYYVYGLIDPRNGKVFYIGKGKQNRMYKHVFVVKSTGNTRTLKNSKIKQILDAGYDDVLYVKYFENLSEKTAYLIEIILIKKHSKTLKLCNMTIGGDAPPRGCLKGRKLSSEHKAKLTAAKIGKPSPRKGKKLTEEKRIKQKEKHSWYSSVKDYSHIDTSVFGIKGEKHFNYNKHLSESTKEKIRSARLGKPARRRIVMYDYYTKEEILCFFSIKDAADYVNAGSANIIGVLQNKRNQSGGHYWKYI